MTNNKNIFQSVRRFVILFFATGFYLAYLPANLMGRIARKRKASSPPKWTGAGFIGSLIGFATYILLPSSIADSIYVVLIGVGISVYISALAEDILQTHDDSRIVIDEWIGVWISFWGMGTGSMPTLIVAFTLFRIFDSLKPPGINQLQNLPRGWGITLDDVGAGILANVLTRFLMPFLTP